MGDSSTITSKCDNLLYWFCRPVEKTLTLNSMKFMSLVAESNILVCNRQGLPGNGAFNFALRLQDVASTSNRRKDINDL